MAHDREFQRRRKDTRMPVRDSHGRINRQPGRPNRILTCAGHGTPLLLSTARHTGRTSLYRRNFPICHRKHRRPCWNRAKRMQPLWMVFRNTLRHRMLPGQRPDTGQRAKQFPAGGFQAFFVTEDVTDHDTGKYAPSSEGSAPPNGTDRSGQEHRYRTHQHGNKYQQRFQEAAQAEEQAAQKEKGMDSEPPKTSKLEFTADELPPETKDKSSPMQDGRRNGLHKKQSRRKIVYLPGRNCAWRRFPTRRPEKPKTLKI